MEEIKKEEQEVQEKEAQKNETPEKEELTPAQRKENAEEFLRLYQEKVKEQKEKLKIAREAMSEGKGRLALETPIISRDEEIKELAYDFTKLTGLEYIEAMDKDQKAYNEYKITYRQALALFSTAAAKETDGLDDKDIMERIGMTDAAEGIKLAMGFFKASARAGDMRISKR